MMGGNGTRWCKRRYKQKVRKSMPVGIRNVIWSQTNEYIYINMLNGHDKPSQCLGLELWSQNPSCSQF